MRTLDARQATGDAVSCHCRSIIEETNMATWKNGADKHYELTFSSIGGLRRYSLATFITPSKLGRGTRYPAIV